MKSLVILAAALFEISCDKKQTDRQAPMKTVPPPATAVGVGS